MKNGAFWPLLVVVLLLLVQAGPSWAFADSNFPDCCQEESNDSDGVSLYCENCVLSLNELFNSQITRMTIKNLHPLGISSKSSWVLSKDNFTGLNNLKAFKLQNSNVREVEDNAFVSLHHLTRIELPQNRIRTVGERPFEGLVLELLTLDDNPDVELHPMAFVKTQIRELSMRNCRLKQIDPALIASADISILNLYNNSIRTLGREFTTVILNKGNSLEWGSINMQRNPLHCSCSMFWLSELLQKREKAGLENREIRQEPDYFQCQSPPELARQNLPLSRVAMCGKAKITQLSVAMLSAQEAQLTCVAQGQEAPAIKWIEGDFIRSPQSFRPSRVQSEDGLDSDLTLFETEYSLNVSLQDATAKPRRFKCSAGIKEGENHEIELRLRVPTVKSSPGINQPDLVQVAPPPKHTEATTRVALQPNGLFEKRYTLIELIGAIMATFALTLFMLYLLTRFIPRCCMRKQHSSTSMNSSNLMYNYQKASLRDGSKSALLLNLPCSGNSVTPPECSSSGGLPSHQPLPPIPGTIAPDYVYSPNSLNEYDIPRTAVDLFRPTGIASPATAATLRRMTQHQQQGNEMLLQQAAYLQAMSTPMNFLQQMPTAAALMHHYNTYLPPQQQPQQQTSNGLPEMDSNQSTSDSSNNTSCAAEMKQLNGRHHHNAPPKTKRNSTKTNLSNNGKHSSMQ